MFQNSETNGGVKPGVFCLLPLLCPPHQNASLSNLPVRLLFQHARPLGTPQVMTVLLPVLVPVGTGTLQTSQSPRVLPLELDVFVLAQMTPSHRLRLQLS